MPAAIPALIIGGAGLAGAAITSSAAGGAAQDAENAAAQNNALEGQIYQNNTKLETPYINAGDTAENALTGFLGLGGNPQATDQAFNDYLNSTGYQFALNQGLDSVAQTKAAQGLLGSGSLVKALDSYGTGLAQQYGQQYVGDLQNLTNTGQGAANGAWRGSGKTTRARCPATTTMRRRPPAPRPWRAPMRSEAPSTAARRPMAATPARPASAWPQRQHELQRLRPRHRRIEMNQTANAFGAAGRRTIPATPSPLSRQTSGRAAARRGGDSGRSRPGSGRSALPRAAAGDPGPYGPASGRAGRSAQRHDGVRPDRRQSGGRGEPGAQPAGATGGPGQAPPPSRD